MAVAILPRFLIRHMITVIGTDSEMSYLERLDDCFVVLTFMGGNDRVIQAVRLITAPPFYYTKPPNPPVGPLPQTFDPRHMDSSDPKRIRLAPPAIPFAVVPDKFGDNPLTPPLSIRNAQEGPIEDVKQIIAGNLSKGIFDKENTIELSERQFTIIVDISHEDYDVLRVTEKPSWVQSQDDPTIYYMIFEPTYILTARSS
jgi:hypothetical protein